MKVKPRGVRGRDSHILPPLGVDMETALKALLGTPNPEPRKKSIKKRKKRARKG